jgi:hypothetical protein
VRRLAVLLLLSFAAAGCMGDDEVSREDYIAKADELCGTYQVRLSQLPRPATASPQELGAFLDRALPIAREQTEKLGDLAKPSDDEVRDQVDQLLALLDQELDFNEEARDAATSGNQGALNNALRQAGAVSAEAGALAEQVGFLVCARSS